MFDIGWGELFLIGIVALIVVGPKDLPGLFRSVGQFTGKARGMAREFQRSLEQAANEAGMTEMQKSLRSIDKGLDAATSSARKFAARPMQTVAKEAVGKALGEGDDTSKPAPAPAQLRPSRQRSPRQHRLTRLWHRPRRRRPHPRGAGPSGDEG